MCVVLISLTHSAEVLLPVSLLSCDAAASSDDSFERNGPDSGLISEYELNKHSQKFCCACFMFEKKKTTPPGSCQAVNVSLHAMLMECNGDGS